MRFKALKFFKGTQPWVGVVQAHHKAHDHLVVLHVVHEGAAISVLIQRPASAVQSQTWLVTRRVYFPKFFDANAITLRVFAVVQFKAFNDFFAQVAACAFGKNGVLGVQRHAQLKTLAWLAIFAHTHVASGHAFD